MSSHESYGRSTHGHCGCRRGDRAELSFMGSMPNMDMSEIVGTPITKIRSQTLMIGDDALSQAMLRVLERVVETHFRFRSQG